MQSSRYFELKSIVMSLPVENTEITSFTSPSSLLEDMVILPPSFISILIILAFSKRLMTYVLSRLFSSIALSIVITVSKLAGMLDS